MQSTLKVEQNNGQVKLTGQLDFETVARILKDASVDFDSASLNGQIDIDLSEITRFNSASLALLLEWMKKAQQKSLQIKYHNAPEQLMVIAQAYGIDHQLPLSASE